MSYWVLKRGDKYVGHLDEDTDHRRCARRYFHRNLVFADRRGGERVVKVTATPRTPSLRDQVAEFHAMIGETSPDHPTMPDYDAVRLRLALVLEETIELMEAAGVYRPMLTETRNLLSDLRGNMAGVRPDMVAMTDALADLAYVVEGSFQRFGIDSRPVLAEVHRSNMAKRGAGKDENGKWQKPPGWKAPDIAGELRRQGWKEGAK